MIIFIRYKIIIILKKQGKKLKIINLKIMSNKFSRFLQQDYVYYIIIFLIIQILWNKICFLSEITFYKLNHQYF